MTGEKQVLDIDKQVHELTALHPIPVTFMGEYETTQAA